MANAVISVVRMVIAVASTATTIAGISIVTVNAATTVMVSVVTSTVTVIVRTSAVMANAATSIAMTTVAMIVVTAAVAISVMVIVRTSVVTTSVATSTRIVTSSRVRNAVSSPVKRRWLTVRRSVASTWPSHAAIPMAR